MTLLPCRVLLIGCATLFVCVLLGVSDAYITTSAEDLQSRDYAYTFEEYMEEYGKWYGVEEMEMRRELFLRRLSEIREHNEDPVRSRLWKKGLNSHTDQTDEELSMLRGYDRALGHYHRRSISMAEATTKKPRAADMISIEELPASLDWRKVPGVLTSIKDQGNCGSCWAFAATATIESHWALATGKIADLSVQSIVSCAENPKHCGGTGGCYGGVPQVAFSHVREYGILSEWDYSYRQYFNNITVPCPKHLFGAELAIVNSMVNVTSNSLEAVMNALQIGPLSVIVDASDWSSYESGIFHGCDLKNTTLDHAVVLVGYGSEMLSDGTEQPYWIIRNSWGTDHGEDGYYRLLRELSSPLCGVDPSDGTACDGASEGPVTVCGTCGLLYDVSYPIVQTVPHAWEYNELQEG